MTETVSQEAREAYLAMSMLPEFDVYDVRAGRWDNTTGLQAFAKFERETLARAAHAQEEPVGFQQGVDQWMDVCFGEKIKADKVERCDRFIEEALEFVQAVGYSADRAHALVDYVFSRDIGEVSQEVGGVMVTLAAACNTIAVDMRKAGETELARVWTKVEAIRAKQAAKPTGSALPIAHPQPSADLVGVLVAARAILSPYAGAQSHAGDVFKIIDAALAKAGAA